MIERNEQPMARNESDDPRWIQLNVGLVRHNGVALTSARALFDAVVPLVDDWRAAAKLQLFYFMRKPPDVRLRLRVVTDGEVRTGLDGAMAHLQRTDQIREFFYSTYEPETERFGGLRGMSSVHDYFDADTAVWLRFDRLERQGRRELTPDELLPALVQDLFLRASGERSELVSRSWQSLWRLIATPAAEALPEVSREALNGLSGLRAVRGLERECIESYARANELLAQDLIRLARDGELQAHLTDVLASVAMFSFHRHGFSGRRSSPLVAAVINALRIESRCPQ